MTLETILYRLQFWLVLGLLLFFLAACESSPSPVAPRIEYRERVVEVAVECVPADLGAALDTEQTRREIVEAPNVFVRVQLLTTALLAAWIRNEEVEAVLSGCRSPEE